MTYQALYQKYRSTTFDEVIGQDYVVKTIQNAVRQNKVGHAYLFCGPRGTGKTTMARLLAKAVNCTDREHAPCGECDSCKAIAAGSHPDVVEINAANETGIDSIRSLIDSAQLVPMQSKYKVYIIDEVHQLTSSAASALLKTLEEPPKHVIFILATTEPMKLLPTIVSRCQRFDFSKVRTELIKQHLLDIAAKENIILEDSAADRIAQLAEGGMRDALSILDQSISYSDGTITEQNINRVYGLTNTQEKLDLLSDIFSENAVGVLNRIRSYEEGGIDLKRFTRDVSAVLRDADIYSCTHDRSALRLINEEQASEICKHVNAEQMLKMIEKLMDTANIYTRVSNASDYFEVACLQIMNICKHDSVRPAAEVAEQKKQLPPVSEVKEQKKQPVIEVNEKEAVPEDVPEDIPLPESDEPEKEQVQEFDQEQILRLVVAGDVETRKKDTEKLASVSSLAMTDFENGRYISVLSQVTIGASSSDAILFKCSEKAVVNSINEETFNRGLYAYLKNSLQIDKMAYAITNEDFVNVCELYKHRREEGTLPPAAVIEKYAIKENTEEDKPDIKENIRKLFGDDDQVKITIEEDS